MRIAEKEQVVTSLGQRLESSKCLYVADFTGLDVASMTELRRRLAEAEVELVVVKNTLARRALADSTYQPLVDQLDGPNAFALSRSDGVAAAKILTNFARERDKPRIKAGVIEGRVVSIEQIRRIAELPSREVLLAQLVGSARAPLSGLVYTLSGLLAKFVRTVDALRAQKASSPQVQA
jgi:large subunit ribosomal protein L10